jgi:hypothetical protein
MKIMGTRKSVQRTSGWGVGGQPNQGSIVAAILRDRLPDSLGTPTESGSQILAPKWQRSPNEMGT